MWVSIYQSRGSSNQLRSKDLSFAAIEFNKSLKFNMLQLKMNPPWKRKFPNLEIRILEKGNMNPRFDKGDEAELGGEITIVFVSMVCPCRCPYRNFELLLGVEEPTVCFFGGKIDVD